MPTAEEIRKRNTDPKDIHGRARAIQADLRSEICTLEKDPENKHRGTIQQLWGQVAMLDHIMDYRIRAMASGKPLFDDLESV